MIAHLRANLCLLVLTVLLCSVLYPLALLCIGQTVFHDKAQGSLIAGPDGKPIGSRLIAQPFTGNEYFQPRPSGASYNGAASAGSNLAASNYLLRDRVARQLGPMVKYKGTPPNGKSVQQDVKEWFADATRMTIVADWAEAHPSVAQAWVNADDKHKEAAKEWMEAHVNAVERWKKDNEDAEPAPSDLAVAFFKDNAEKFHATWPQLIDDPTWSVEAVFFDMWLQDHPTAQMEQVPADMVTASGSGLDPHITLESGVYQLDRVAAAWAEKTKRKPADLRTEILEILNHQAEAPLGGLVGVDLVNVLEVNLALREKYGR